MWKKIFLIFGLIISAITLAQAEETDDEGNKVEIIELSAEVTVEYYDKWDLLIFDVSFQNPTDKAICIRNWDFNYDVNKAWRFLSVKTARGNELHFLGDDPSRGEIALYPDNIGHPFYVIPPKLFLSNSFEVFNAGENDSDYSRIYQFLKGEHEYEVSFHVKGYFCRDFDNFTGRYLREEMGLFRQISISSEPVNFTFKYPPGNDD